MSRYIETSPHMAQVLRADADYWRAWRAKELSKPAYKISRFGRSAPQGPDMARESRALRQSVVAQASQEPADAMSRFLAAGGVINRQPYQGDRHPDWDVAAASCDVEKPDMPIEDDLPHDPNTISLEGAKL